MFIKFSCINGHSLKVRSALAGKRVKCPKCSEATVVPGQEPELIELSPVELEPTQNFGIDLPGEPDWSSPIAMAPTAYDVDVAKPLAPKTISTQNHSSANGRPSALALSLVGIGSLCSVLLFALLGWLLFSAKQEKAPLAKREDNIVPAQDAAPSLKSNVESGPKPQSQATQPSQPEPQSPAATLANELRMSGDKAPVDVQIDPTKLVRFFLDQRVEAFLLPSNTWSFAYDTSTGRFAITNDEKGVVIFDLDELFDGKLEPIAEFETQGLPRGICLKKLPNNRRAFVYIETGTTKLNFVDADTVELFDDIPIENASLLNGVAASLNPLDPYVYFSSYKPEENFRNHMGRFDVLHAKQELCTTEAYNDFRVSESGDQIVARRTDGQQASSSYGTWQDFTSATTLSGNAVKQLNNANYPGSPAFWIENKLAIADSVHQWANDLKGVSLRNTGRLDFDPHVYHESSSIVFGLGTNKIVFGSPNDFHRFETIPFPEKWRRKGKEEKVDPRYQDPRYRVNICPRTKSTFYDAVGDDVRNLVIAAFDAHIIIAPLNRLKLAHEKLLVPSVSLPTSIRVGESIDLDLNAKDKEMSVDLILNSRSMGEEGISIFGDRPIKQVIQLASGLDEKSDLITLQSSRELTEVDLPCRLKIGSEILRALEVVKTGRGNTMLRVERSKEMAHLANAEVTIVDDRGHIPPSEFGQSGGTAFALAAGVNETQTVILMNRFDVKKLQNRPFPIAVQLGTERMLVDGIDNFDFIFKVQRNQGVAHAVTERMVIVEEEKAPDVPTIENGVLHWKPTMASIGKTNVRLEAKLGNTSRQWLWPVEITSPITADQLPFNVLGIQADYDSDLVVVWGIQNDPVSQTLPQKHVRNLNPDGPSILAIYDIETKKLVHQTKLNAGIRCAVMDKAGVFVFGQVPAPNKSTGAFVNQMIRLNRKTLAEVAKVPFQWLGDSGESCSLSIIGESHIALNTHGVSNQPQRIYCPRFTIPDLKMDSFQWKLDPFFTDEPATINGQMKEGWVLNGVLWDKTLKNRKLLLFPRQIRPTPQRLLAEEGVVSILTQGPYASVLSPKGMGLSTGFRLRDRVGTVGASADAFFSSFSLNCPIREPRIGYQRLPFDSSVPNGAFEMNSVISESRTNVFAIRGGMIRIIPKTMLAEPKPTFQFIEQQDAFVLEAGKRKTVSYHAPGASKYRLRMWYVTPRIPANETDVLKLIESAVVDLQSSDGSFELELDTLVAAKAAISQAIPDRFEFDNVQERQAAIVAYIKSLSGYVKEISGKEPKSVPLVAVVQVIAQHENGKEHAGLLHCYLVEPPVKVIQQLLKDGFGS